MQETVGRDGLFVIDILPDRRQSVRRRSNSAAVQTEIVVFLSVPQEVEERRWDKPHIVNAFRDAVAFRLNCRLDIRKQSIPILSRRQVTAQNLVHQLREIHRADVGNVVSHIRDDELPTGGNHIVDRILVVIA